VSLETLTNPYFATMDRALQKYASQHGMKVEVESCNFSQSQMLTQVENFIGQHVAAIIINPPSSKASATTVLAANKANIPVFTIDTSVDPKALKDAGAKLVESVESNNFQAGVIAGQEMVNYLGGKGEVGMDDYTLNTAGQDRDAGFFSVINKYPGIKVVERLNCEGNTPGGLKVTSEMLAAHPSIRAIYDINAPSGLGAMQAIIAAKKVGQVGVIGLSGSQEAIKAIEDNSVYKAGAMQSPRFEAEALIANIDKYLHGQSVPPQVLTKVVAVTKDNAAKYFPLGYH
jgi:ribose transport system substrate-binding protein